jgi:ABC-type proline/glycine betaine transport system substrate-binding protein
MILTTKNTKEITKEVTKILNKNGWNYSIIEIEENDAMICGDFIGYTPEQIAKEYMESNPQDKE